MMQAGVRVTITATSNGVTAIRRNDPMPAGAVTQGELLDKADFRPMTSEKVKTVSVLGGIVLRAQAPRWALNPITAQAHAPQGSIVLTKTGGDALGKWASIGIRPAFEWCLVLPQDIRLTGEPMEVSGTLVAFIPNGGDVDKNVRDVISKCTIADIDRVRAIYTSLAKQSEDAANRASKDSPPPINETGGSSVPPIPGPRGTTPPLPPGPGGARPGGPPPPPSRGGPPSMPPPRITPPRPTS
jgi:hypothetical protein